MKIGIILIKKEENISKSYGTRRYIDDYRFLSSSSDSLDETLGEEVFKVLKREFTDK